MIVSENYYQIVLLGKVDERLTSIKESLLSRLKDFNINPDFIKLIHSDDYAIRDVKYPTIAIYFGGDKSKTQYLSNLIDESIVIIPVVQSNELVPTELPDVISHINALPINETNNNIERLVSIIFENFRFLRKERKVFISYRRIDAQGVADKLYDILDANGFDVFLDTRSVPPAQNFQDQLWHRMTDSDAVILLDTPRFRTSRWTKDELMFANENNIHILHILWPQQMEEGIASFNEFIKLAPKDFKMKGLSRSGIPYTGKNITKKTLKNIVIKTEQLRARAISLRYKYLVDNFCDAARDAGYNPSVQIDQWISIANWKENGLAVIPAIGVPTADRINDIYNAVSNSKFKNSEKWIIYDNRGILKQWLEHLDWLDNHLPIKAVNMTKAPSLLETE
ncbi:toll/interleukin-1 receptor domain-containing protein [Acinetobacter schindleri]|nr:toll/interleukin-1 receptor domain-containing protein [Acinetobacter schindleri]